MGWFWGAVLWISAVTATFLGFYPVFGLNLEAVLWIFAVTATFHVILPVYGLNFGSCFKRFRDYSSPRSAYDAIKHL